MLPQPQDAYDHLVNSVHARVFFDTLSRVGVVPQTTKEAQDLLSLAGQLRPLAMQKEAEDSRFSGALNALERTLNGHGMQPHGAPSPQQRQVAIKQAAAQLLEDPVNYNSLLSLVAYEQSAT